MKFLPAVFAHNWKLKLAAVGMAVLLWGVMRQPASSGLLPNVPVRVQVDDPGWQLVGRPDPPRVTVQLGGPTSDIQNLGLNPPPVVIPVDSVHRGDTTVILNNNWVDLDAWPDVFARGIEPRAVRLIFDSVTVAAVPVAPRLVEELRSEVALTEEISTSPTVVRVRGPAEEVQAVDSVPLMPFDLSEVQESGEFTIPVDTAGLGSLTATPREVTLQIRVAERVERVLSGVPVQPEEGEFPDLEVEPATLQLRLVGPLPRVRSVSAEEVRVVFSADAVDGMEEGEERRVSVSVEGIPGLVRVTALDASGDSVTVRRRPPEGEDDSGSGG